MREWGLAALQVRFYAVTRDVVPEVGNGEKALGGGEGMMEQDAEFEPFSQPDGDEADGSQSQGDHVLEAGRQSDPRPLRGIHSFHQLTKAFRCAGDLPFNDHLACLIFGAGTATGEPQLTWKSRSGDDYTIWSCAELLAPQWAVEATIASGGETTTWTDPDAASTRRFYRIGIR